MARIPYRLKNFNMNYFLLFFFVEINITNEYVLNSSDL